MTDTAASFTARDFRDALGRFATGVTIVTARDENGAPIGMTASSFNSVSVDPPLVLWSVTKTANSAAGFHAAEHFAIHVLGSGQTDLSNRFASKGVDKFAELALEADAAGHGVPCLPACAARFECRQWAVYEGGDHWIIVGEVLNLHHSDREPLVFSGGVYATAEPLTRPTKPTDTSNSVAKTVEELLFYELSRAYHDISDSFHDAVRSSGLSVAEWRVLACLAGGASYDEATLAAKAFLQPSSLRSITRALSDEGLCLITPGADGPAITGTDAGAARVADLFVLARDQEAASLGRLQSIDGAALKSALREIQSAD